METTPDKSKYTIVFPQLKAQMSELPLESTMDFGSYFRPLFNLFYYGGLVPFKIIQADEKSYVLTTNSFHKLLCGVIQTLFCLASFGEIHATVAGPVPSNLNNILRLLDSVNKFTSCCFFFYAGWFKEKSIVAIFGKPEAFRCGRRKTEYFMIFLTTLVLLFSISAFFISHPLILDSNNGFNTYAQQFLFDLFLPSVEDENISIGIGLQIISFVSLFVRFYKWIFIDLVYCLLDIIAFVALILGKNFRKLLLQSTGNSFAIEQNVFNYYYKIEEMINRFNHFVGPMFLSTFITLIFYCAVSTADILNSKTIAFPLITLVYFLSATLKMFFAAEAHYQISQLKAWILNPKRRSLLTTAKCMEIENSNVALRGGRFFTVTYSFLGTASSVVLTYAIMMVQLRGNGSSSDDTK